MERRKQQDPDRGREERTPGPDQRDVETPDGAEKTPDESIAIAPPADRPDDSHAGRSSRAAGPRSRIPADPDDDVEDDEDDEDSDLDDEDVDADDVEETGSGQRRESTVSRRAPLARNG